MHWRSGAQLTALAALAIAGGAGCQPTDLPATFDQVRVNDPQRPVERAMGRSAITRWFYDRGDYEISVDFRDGRTATEGAGGNGKTAWTSPQMDLPTFAVGLLPSQIESLLGKPNYICELYERRDGAGWLVICFANGRVLKKEFHETPPIIMG
jgi:hypothetical protein